jgi:hypothetical protein
MRLSSLVLGIVLVSTSAGSDELVWTSVGKVKSLRVTNGGRVDFRGSQLNLCESNNDRYFIQSMVQYNLPLLMSAMANEFEVRIVAREYEKTDLGIAVEVEALMIVRP